MIHAMAIDAEGFQGKSPAELLARMGSTEAGLTSAEALERLARFGPNGVEEKRIPPLLQFLKRYWGPMPWLLEVAIALSVLSGHVLEAVIIFFLLTVNAVIGFLESRNSQRAVSMMTRRLEAKAKVLRDGTWQQADSRSLVPGDVLTLKLGDLVPADAALLEGQLSVDQSTLTGESLPVSIHACGVVYSGTAVVRGEAKAVVANTRASTYFGKTGQLVQVAAPASRPQALMLTITRNMLYIGARGGRPGHRLQRLSAQRLPGDPVLYRDAPDWSDPSRGRSLLQYLVPDV